MLESTDVESATTTRTERAANCDNRAPHNTFANNPKTFVIKCKNAHELLAERNRIELLRDVRSSKRDSMRGRLQRQQLRKAVDHVRSANVET